MQLFKKIPFDHDEKNYEICIFFEDNLINFSTFQNNYPVNGFRYQVQLPKYVDIEKILCEENLTDFIDMAKTDIIENRWQKFTKLFS
jgi:hypothetical protein